MINPIKTNACEYH